jgi:hypothetical protein
MNSRRGNFVTGSLSCCDMQLALKKGRQDEYGFHQLHQLHLEKMAKTWDFVEGMVREGQ